jgi:predicted AAA+ superfamily ATPase
VFLDPAAGVDHGDVVTRTLWGEIAYQLGAHGAVRANDEEGTAPGTRTLKRVFGDRPTIVLIDELAWYLAVASGHRVGTKTLADQTTAFLMSLLELASSAERLVVV